MLCNVAWLAFACQSAGLGGPLGTDEDALGGAFTTYPELNPGDPATDSDSPDDRANPWMSGGGGALGHDGEPVRGTGSQPSGDGGDTSPPGTGGDTSPGGSGTQHTGQGSASTGSANGGGGDFTVPVPEAAQLRLRGYYESTSADKLVLIEHLGGGPSLDCSVQIFSNGGTNPWRSLSLPEDLLPGDRVVLCLAEAHHPACDVVFGGSAFNGNDALRLQCGGATLDLIGTIGVDPGEAWTAPGFDGEEISTADQGLWRCAEPNAAAITFVPSEWVSWDPVADPQLEGPQCNIDRGWGGASVH